MTNRRAALLASRKAAIALRRLRPDLKPICDDLIGSAELQMRHPDCQAFKDAGKERSLTLDKMMGVG